MLIYLPNTGFEREEKRYEWRMGRAMVRGQLDLPYTPEDIAGKRRDIYTQEETLPAAWALHYNQYDQLSALEVYEGVDITVEHISLLFNKDMDWLIPELQTLSPYKVVKPGKYFFPDLKMMIANKTACGSTGSELAYFYASSI